MKQILATLSIVTTLSGCGLTTEKTQTNQNSDAQQPLKEKTALLSAYLGDSKIAEKKMIQPGYCELPTPEPMPLPDVKGPVISDNGAPDIIRQDEKAIGAEPAQQNTMHTEPTVQDIVVDDSRCIDDIVAFESNADDSQTQPGVISRCASPEPIDIMPIENPPVYMEPQFCGAIDHKVLALCGLDSGDITVSDLSSKGIENVRQFCVYLSCDLIPATLEQAVMSSKGGQASPSLEIKHKKFDAAWSCNQFNPENLPAGDYATGNTEPGNSGSSEAGSAVKSGASL